MQVAPIDNRESWYALIVSILTYRTPDVAFQEMTGVGIDPPKKPDFPKEYEEVRKLYESGVSMLQISKRTGVKYFTVRNILGRHNYK